MMMNDAGDEDTVHASLHPEHRELISAVQGSLQSVGLFKPHTQPSARLDDQLGPQQHASSLHV